MKDDKLSDLNIEALQKRRKTLMILTILLAVMLLILLCASLYITFTQKFTPLLIMPFALSPIVFLNMKNIKNIDKEIRSKI